VRTLAGFLYLAIVLDVFSRRIVGWAMEPSLEADLVLAALQMAIAQRGPEDVIHHSDQGSQYTSLTFGKRCRDAGIALSMGSVGDCYDNAMAESFFASLECELLDQSSFRNHPEAKGELFRYIEGWYNTHPPLGASSQSLFFWMSRPRSMGKGTPLSSPRWSRTHGGCGRTLSAPRCRRSPRGMELANGRPLASGGRSRWAPTSNLASRELQPRR